MAEEKKIEQPSVDLQELLDSVLHDEPTEFVFRGKKHKIGWLRKGTMSRGSHIRAKEKNEWKRNVKILRLHSPQQHLEDSIPVLDLLALALLHQGCGRGRGSESPRCF